MSRDSYLDASFSVTEAEMPLAEQLADLLNDQFSIDLISTSEKGYSIEVWSSEHYYLSEVMPMITRIVAAVFPDREIGAEGRGEYDVVDDVYEYSAKYDPSKKDIYSERDHNCEGTGEVFDTEYHACRPGLTDEELEEMLRFTGEKGYTQLHDHLLVLQSIPESLANGSGWVEDFRYCEVLADEKGFIIVNGTLYGYIGSESSVVIPDGVTSIGDWAFESCENLTTVFIPYSVTGIGDSAFAGCESLTDITIPDSVTEIGEFVFEGCSSLSSVEIPSSVMGIGDGVFWGCESFTSAGPIGSGCDYQFGWTEAIPAYAFKGCSGLNSVTIPNSVLSIGESAFFNCKNLPSIKIPNSVISIGEEAFEDCSSLTSITIPNSVTEIGDRAFSWCSSLTGFTISSSVTSISDYTFCKCNSLTSFTIPDSVTSIGKMAFYDCSSLESITIPGSVTEIGDEAFADCDKLTIHAPAGSAAEAYARENNIPFAAL